VIGRTLRVMVALLVLGGGLFVGARSIGPAPALGPFLEPAAVETTAARLAQLGFEAVAVFLGHAITRFALFLCTGHTGQTKPRGREVEEIEKRRRPPEGWRVIGPRESPSRDR